MHNNDKKCLHSYQNQPPAPFFSGVGNGITPVPLEASSSLVSASPSDSAIGGTGVGVAEDRSGCATAGRDSIGEPGGVFNGGLIEAVGGVEIEAAESEGDADGCRSCEMRCALKRTSSASRSASSFFWA